MGKWRTNCHWLLLCRDYTYCCPWGVGVFVGRFLIQVFCVVDLFFLSGTRFVGSGCCGVEVGASKELGNRPVRPCVLHHRSANLHAAFWFSLSPWPRVYAVAFSARSKRVRVGFSQTPSTAQFSGLIPSLACKTYSRLRRSAWFCPALPASRAVREQHQPNGAASLPSHLSLLRPP